MDAKKQEGAKGEGMKKSCKEVGKKLSYKSFKELGKKVHKKTSKELDKKV